MEKRDLPRKLKKSLGQYFLIAPHIAEKTADAAEVSSDDIVLEVGPGGGALTRVLLSRAREVVAVEKDFSLIQELKETFAEDVRTGKLTLIHKDILKLDLTTIELSDRRYKVVANIPYYITGALIRMLLTASVQPSVIVLVVQKEIAERVAKSTKESLLSLSVKAYGAPRYVSTIKRGAFQPPPKVDSAILAIENISRGFFTDVPEDFFFKVLKTGFGSKRKYLMNNLEKIADKKTLRNAFQKIGLQEGVRAEDVPLKEWGKLCHFLSKS
ncbi:ribosomal RNA small subunit methyltransferase A [Candidatus Kaiserbacteria bacterium]|nr:ribosomal RNA small subunit methyltransferase A [Candidatus Kaiserbacteria bacterium]